MSRKKDQRKYNPVKLSCQNYIIPTNKEELYSEYVKCRTDINYYLRQYAIIQHPMDGKINFDLYPFQETTLSELTVGRFNIVLKSRQLGISTLIAGFCTWMACFSADQQILVLSKSQKVAINLLDKVKLIYKYTPAHLKPSVAVWNRTSVEFSNGSKIFSSTTNEDSGRSEALSALIVDEAASINKLDEIWKAAFPTLSTGGRCVLLSTPKGQQGLFYELWQAAEQDQKYGNTEDLAIFNPILLSWDVHPDRDQKWFDTQEKVLGARGTAQELLCSFIGSGNTVIDSTVTSKIHREALERKKTLVTGERGVKIYVPPNPEHEYVLSGDCAKGGSDGDFFAFTVIDMQTLEVVCTYKGRIKAKQYSLLVNNVGGDYNNALAIIENNAGYGDEVNERLMNEIGYANVYEIPVSSTKIQVGWNTNVKTRAKMIAALEHYLDAKHGRLRVYCLDIHGELITFIWNGKKAQHTKGKHDDLTISLSIGLAYLHQYELDNGELLGKGQEVVYSGFSDALSAIDAPNVPLSPYEEYMKRTQKQEEDKEEDDPYGIIVA